MRLPIRNKGDKPLTIFIEPVCDQFEIPVGGEAIVILEDGHPHSFDWFDDAWLSIWNEGHQRATIAVRATHASTAVKRLRSDPAQRKIDLKNGLCCFCSQPVDASGFDPCTLTFTTNSEGSQSWPCHAACYRERLGDLPYGDALFEDDDI